VVPEGKSRGPKPALSRASSSSLVEHLAHPNGWWRDTAQRLLVERRDTSVVPLLMRMAAEGTNAVARLHALWTLEGMRHLPASAIEAALRDSNAKVRAAAVRLAEQPLKQAASDDGNAQLREKLLALATDASTDVQIQLALTLSLLPLDEKTKPTILALAGNASTPHAREAASFVAAGFEPVKAEAVVAASGRPLTDEEKRRYDAGRMMYEATCLACHQQHGLGQPGLAPPLAGSEWVAGSERRLIRIVLHGLRGPIKVKGEPFELDMPSLGVLDDEQIASALTYIRREWGHTFEPVSPGAVKKVRDETAEREDAWTMADLLKIP
jgi:mono/diheme cytochrome c family protein